MTVIECNAVNALECISRTNEFHPGSPQDELVILSGPLTYRLRKPAFLYAEEPLTRTLEGLLWAKEWDISWQLCARTVGSTVFSHHDIITSDGNLLYDMGSFGAPPSVHRCDDGRLIAAIERAEPVECDHSAALLFFHSASGGNHSHWLMNTLPKLSMFRRAGVAPDLYVVQPSIKEYQRKTLECLGITPDRLLIRSPEQPVRFRELYSTNTWSCMVEDVSIYDELISRVEEDPQSPALVYVGRSDARLIRSFLNEDRIMAVARKYGFTIVIPSELTFEEEVRMFRNARVIAGPLGAGLCNAVFTKPGATILALSDSAYVIDWQLQIASLRGHEIGYALGNSFLSYDIMHKGTQSAWVLDPVIFEKALKEIGVSPVM